jgi:hypothetical protein
MDSSHVTWFNSLFDGFQVAPPLTVFKTPAPLEA